MICAFPTQEPQMSFPIVAQHWFCVCNPFLRLWGDQRFFLIWQQKRLGKKQKGCASCPYLKIQSFLSGNFWLIAKFYKLPKRARNQTYFRYQSVFFDSRRKFAFLWKKVSWRICKFSYFHHLEQIELKKRVCAWF